MEGPASRFRSPCTIKKDVIAAIGNTPLIRLRRASEATGCEILGKAEFLNPGQSVKDRAALFIIQDAIRRGTLTARRHHRRRHRRQYRHRAGDWWPMRMGFKTVIVIPDTQSQEKKDALRLLGAELIEVPAVPYKNPNNYVQPVGAAGRAAGEDAKRMARSGPTSSTMSPTARPISKAPARKSGSRPTARWTASPARWAPAAPWPASPSR